MKIPGYTIIRELGSGGMATVYLARQDRLTRDVALKVMKPIAMAGGDFTSRFVKEGQIIAQLQHPQIVTIYDFDSSDGYHYFSMEYLPGGTLADEIKRGMPVSRAIGIVKRVAEALAVAHARGVIHRDVKPQNILFRGDGTPVLTDFGIARAVTRDPDSMQLTSYGMVIGSPRYMSPEQSTGQPLDARSDLYSLGVVFYEMLTGSLPYEADDVVSLAMKHCNDPIPRLTGALEPYQPILDKLIAKKPDDRFAGAGQLIRALESLEGTTTAPLAGDDATRILPRGQDRTQTREPEPSAPAAKTGRRPFGRLFALIAILLVLGVGAAVLWPRISDQPRYEILAQLPPATSNRPEVVARYEDLAIRHFLDANVDASLGAIKLGLAVTPDDARLIKLRSLIEQRMEAERLLGQARGLQRQNQLPESLALVERALKLAPELKGLARLKAELEQQIDALKARQADDLLAQARSALEADRLDDAERLAQEGLALAPDHQGLKALSAEVEQRREDQRDLEAMLRHIRDLIASQSLDEADAAIARALKSHSGDERLLDLKRTVAREREDLERRRIASLIERAQEALADGQLDQAMSQVAQGLERDPDNQDLQALKERILAAKKDQDEALQRRADAILGRAQAAFDQGELKESEDLVAQGLDLVPGHAGLEELRERILATKDKAGQIAKRVAECGARFPTAEVEISGALDAYTCYQAVLALDPPNSQAKSAIGALGDRVASLIPPLLDAYRLDEAEAAITRLEQISPAQGQLAALREDLKQRRDFFPDMVAIQGGCFQMGSPESEAGRELDERLHHACVDDFQLGRSEVSVEAFRAFVKASGYQTDAERSLDHLNGCEALDRDNKDKPWGIQPWASWSKPNKKQAARDKEPVVCVSSHDAQRYIAWLNEKTRHSFRLPTEAEWEYAARAGSTSARFWSNSPSNGDTCQYANAADKPDGWTFGFPCNDGYEWVAPIGSFKPNPWGLLDMLGNVWEWTCSEYDADYRGQELLCAAATNDKPRVMRGGAWNSGPPLVRSAYRNRNFPEASFSFTGFRLAHDSPAQQGQRNE